MGILSRAALLALAIGAFSAHGARAQVDLSEVGHLLGDPQAPIHVVEFSDFACGACGEFARDTFGELRRLLIESGRVVWRQVPFELGFRRGREATMAAECAADQDAFWPMHDVLFEQQALWRETRDLDETLMNLAEGIGLDAAEFSRCLEDETPDARIDLADEAARRLGVRATPAFYIQGQPFLGALSAEQFIALIEVAEADAGGGGGRR